MVSSSSTLRVRKDFSKIPKVLEIDVKPENRKDVGLQAVFKSVYPIKDFNETSSLEFVNYTLGEPKYDVLDCQQRGMTFAAPMRVTVRLVVWDKNDETGAQTIRDIKEQEVYFGEIPLMTRNGTFIINGTERVIVSQLHRSPGVFFDHDKGKTHVSGKVLYVARVIPYRGSWLDFEFDPKDILYVRIDRRRKFYASVLLRALGYSIEEILNYFYKSEVVTVKNGKVQKKTDFELLLNQHAPHDILDPKTGESIVKAKKKITRLHLKKMKEAGIEFIPIEFEDVVGKIAAADIYDSKTGEVVVECNGEITPEKIEEIKKRKITEFKTLFIDQMITGTSIRDTLMLDKISTPEDALIEIYKRLRPGEPPTRETARTLFDNMFFNPDRYDLSRVGRLKLNHKLGRDLPIDQLALSKEDILAVVRYLVDLKNGIGEIDDIDHLGNRRVRAVGELLENQYRIGLVRMERAVKERMSLQDIQGMMPHDLINPKPVAAIVKEFFGSSQLSQFMDQTNPLSEITHKRRLSALGPGGLTRERAGFEVRDVHPTHYGRICPIETPEGPNIGLIASLSTYGRVNEYGFIETPYRVVEGGKVSKEIKFLTALEEEEHVIAQADAPLDKEGRFNVPLISARRAGEFIMVRPEDVTLMDVSPKQLVSVAASLIPFLEHDDANRALMGSNMQRQAVPLLRTEAPLIGTGMEHVVARDSGVAIVGRREGVVESVDASRIVIKAKGGAGVDIYDLIKYQKSNQGTCLNQKPIVKEGDNIAKGQIVADGPATDNGELALGKNIVVAFMPWRGFNFEDSILISEKLVKEDTFTSVHIEELEVAARDTKLGKEDITADIPNVGEESLKDLDESGIIRIGARVKPGDILVGKVTPKSETQLTPEEKLLRAIFGEKAGDVRDTSLKVPPGIEGTVINVKVFSRKGVEKDERSKGLEDLEISKMEKDRSDEVRVIQEGAYSKLKALLVGSTVSANILDDDKKVILAKGKKIAESLLEKVPRSKWAMISVSDNEVEAEIEKVVDNMNDQIELVKTFFVDKINRLKKGDELPPGVIKLVKVSVAMKRKLQPGDKMAGRHGNKGVLSKIVPDEDMPYLSDGTPVDMVLNPLGVPSRMNVGQILEIHLGWAAKGLGQQINTFLEKNYSASALKSALKKTYNSPVIARIIDGADDEAIFRMARDARKGIHMATPVFEGASEDELNAELERAGLPESAQSTLYDGRTGIVFDSEVTVGVMYMLKLHHLVDDKIHARSIGPYSLVTQQPLGGKAQFGGQRFGEMEVWALQAYGAAYTLQEILTVKSDDVTGRIRAYEAIVKGENLIETGLPESFKVLVKELQSLALDVELLEKKEE
ncbi:MAG: rpoB [Deltaproteobacteria bacterium]|nr:rpoB [Deltaproteobacteria bacterium]